MMVNLRGNRVGAGEFGACSALSAAITAAASIGALTSVAAAQPVFDGTTGGQAPGTVATSTIDVSQGTRAGGNVFHSFSSFSIGDRQSVTFTDNNPTTPVARIINRVTGTQLSEINGSLHSAVLGADFYLINPNGVVVGPGGTITVPAGLHISTSDELRFRDGTVLRSEIGSSSFTSAVPEAFDFTDTTIGDITISGGRILYLTADLTLTGGDVTISDGPNGEAGYAYTSGSGSLSITAVAGVGRVALDPHDTVGLPTAFGDLSISRVARSANPFFTASDPIVYSEQGHIFVRANNIALDRTGFYTRGGAISLVASGDVTLRNEAHITVQSFDSPGGDISIDARNITLLCENLGIDGSDTGIQTEAWGTGAAGDIILRASQKILIDGNGVPETTQSGIGSYVGGSSGGTGDLLGSIAIRAAALDIINNGQIEIRGFPRDLNAPQSNTKVLDIALTDTLTLSTGGRISSVLAGQYDILISAKNALIGAASSLASISQSNVVRGGNISINVTGELALNGSIGTTNVGAGDPGHITMSAKNLFVSGSLLTGNTIPVSTDGTSGNGTKAGNISLDAELLEVSGVISSETGTQFAAGNLFLSADTLRILDGGAVRADSAIGAGGRASGPAGNVRIDAGAVEISSGGLLSAVAYGSADAGSIVVCCSTSFTVTGAGSKVIAGTAPGSSGNAGTIMISAKDVKLRNGGRMTVATEGTGRGGEILVRAQRFSAEDPNRTSEGRTDSEAAGLATLSSAAGSGSGSAGRIMIEAAVFNLFDGAVITTDTLGTAPAGGISLRASELNIKGARTLVTSRAVGTGGGDAGNIDIGTVNFALSDGASFSTLAQSGAGGNIKFAWNGLGKINNASVTTDVLGGPGGGGTIAFGGTVEPLDFDTLFRLICDDPGTVFSIYDGGLPKYDPNSTATPVLQLTNATITAKAQQGPGGTVIIEPRVTLISGADNPPVIDVSSTIGPDGSVLSPAPFAPPSTLIVPERNATTRCAANRYESSVTDSLSGRAAVGTDPSVLPPAGLTTSADALLATVAERLCAV